MEPSSRHFYLCMRQLTKSSCVNSCKKCVVIVKASRLTWLPQQKEAGFFFFFPLYLWTSNFKTCLIFSKYWTASLWLSLCADITLTLAAFPACHSYTPVRKVRPGASWEAPVHLPPSSHQLWLSVIPQKETLYVWIQPDSLHRYKHRGPSPPLHTHTLTVSGQLSQLEANGSLNS